MIKILHLSADDMFLDNAFEQFETVFPNSNDVVVWSDSKELKKVKSKANVVISINEIFTSVDISSYHVIIYHSLSVTHANFINSVQLADNQVTIWMLHGYEIYSLPIYKSEQIFSLKTIANFIPKSKPINLIKNGLRPLVEKFIKTDSSTILKAAKKIDYLGILYKEEYEHIKSKLNLKLEWFPFTYYPIEKIVPKKTGQVSVNRNNILIGNSASESNNHIDVLEKLKEIGLLENQKIICPLSYGNLDYASQLIQEGQALFGSSFMPLTDFMPIEEYNKITSTCSITIMNHYRQQAVGTVLAMVYLGSKVFLSPQNTLYHYLKRIKVTIFSIEVDLNTQKDLLPLSQEEQDNNRFIMLNKLNSEYLINELRKNLRNI